jgi:hypothetical protein
MKGMEGFPSKGFLPISFLNLDEAYKTKMAIDRIVHDIN